MTEYTFALVVHTSSLSDEEILDAADALGDAGCLDASIRGHEDGMELVFDREAASLQEAISSAVADTERAGFRVAKIEMERESILPS